MAWIRRVVPDEGDSNQSRWPTDPAWKVVQSAIFADAPAEARRLIRRKQRGADEIVLDGVQFGCMVSRVANRHADGGQWTLSRALRDALPHLEKVEAKKAVAGKDFGELVRERRRQRGLPVPIAEKVLPFRLAMPNNSADEDLPVTSGQDTDGIADRNHRYLESVRQRLTSALHALDDAVGRGATESRLRALEEAYFQELVAFQAAVACTDTAG